MKSVVSETLVKMIVMLFALMIFITNSLQILVGNVSRRKVEL